ncbi:MAG: hypothetical protein ACE5K1_07025 [Acidiferrobacterales bacterium]
MNEIVSVVMSWFILIIGLSYLFQAREWIKVAKDAIENTHQLFVVFLFVLLLGLVVVTAHNTWILGPAVVITIIGWAMVIESVIFLVLSPVILKNAWASLENKMSVLTRVSGVILTVLGAILVYQNVIA